MGVGFAAKCGHSTTHSHLGGLCSAGCVAAKSTLIRALRPEEGGGDWCPSCGGVHAKSVGDPRWAANRPPSGVQVTAMRTAIVQMFELQHQRVLAYYDLLLVPPVEDKSMEQRRTKDAFNKPPIDFSEWTRSDAKKLVPAIEMHYDEGANRALARIGVTPDKPWSVHSPGVQRAIERHSIRLCADTAATTSMQLNAAVEAVKREVSAGLLAEETSRGLLTTAINNIFQDAERWRAARIAVTEASMALHDGEILAGAESGVVTGYEPLISDDACPICLTFGEAFDFVSMGDAVAGIGEYASATSGRVLPPYHPNCACSQIERLND